MHCHHPFWCKNANLRFINVFCDSFKKIVFRKAVTTKLMVNIQDPVCSFVGTAFSRHRGQNLFTYFLIITSLFTYSLPQFGRSFNCLNFWGAEQYVLQWKVLSESYKMDKKLDILDMKTLGVCLPLYLVLRLLWGVGLRIRRLQLTWNSMKGAKNLLHQL